MKSLLLSLSISVLTLLGVNNATAPETVETVTNELESNQTVLYYMYSEDGGHYFLDPNAAIENVIYIGVTDHKVLPALKIDSDNLHHGKKFVGTFADSSLWELIGLEEVK